MIVIVMIVRLVVVCMDCAEAVAGSLRSGQARSEVVARRPRSQGSWETYAQVSIIYTYTLYT